MYKTKLIALLEGFECQNIGRLIETSSEHLRTIGITIAKYAKIGAESDLKNISGAHKNAPYTKIVDGGDMTKKEITTKTLHNSDVSGAHKNVPDIKTFGNGDMFQLLCKASSKKEGWMKSTKACEIENIGCIIQVTTQQGDHVAEAICFVPGVEIVDDVNNGRRLAGIGI